jgi:outer membrane protein OmpA-like peptidoglycan-associated protein/tetratricopeptide (TPR) repeat protein
MKTVKFYLIMILTAFGNAIVQGQPTNKELKLADNFYKHKRYAEALPNYIHFLKSNPEDPEVNFKAGTCYWNSRSQKEKAIPFLEKAIEIYSNTPSAEKKSFEANKLLGDVFQQQYRFDDAIVCYEKCRVIMEGFKEQKETEELSGKIEMCKIGKALNGLASDTEVKKNELEKESFSSSSATLSSDKSTITFTFKKTENKGENNNDSRYFETKKLKKSDSVYQRDIKVTGKKINKYEATIATSFDGQIVLTYRDENGSAVLYTSSLRGNHWTAPEKLNKTANLWGWESNEYISSDGSKMYFISDRKGGYGGKDIYVCKKLENGEWSKAVNMGPLINTPFDEEAPFIHPDGKTFYFSSNGHNKKGYFEIFNTIISDSAVVSAPLKVGFPIDTTVRSVEALLYVDPPVEKGRHKKHAKNKIEEQDDKSNYIISFSNPNGIPLTLVKGTFIERAGKFPGQVTIEIKNNETGQTSAYYLTDALSHDFAFILPPSSNNNVSFKKDSFLIVSENLDITDNKNYYKKLDPVILVPLERDAITILNNVFFEPDKSIILSTSKSELNNWVYFLNNNPDLSIEIVGVGECTGKIRETSRLCSNRAEALMKYFIDNGIDKERIEAKGYALKLKRAENATFRNKIELRITEDESSKNKILTKNNKE